MRKEIENYSNQITQFVHTATTIPRITRSTQTESLQIRERSVQCGVTQVSHLEIR